MLKASIHQENIPFLNVYIPNNRDSKYMKKKSDRIKRKNRIMNMIVEDLNTSFSESGQ